MLTQVANGVLVHQSALLRNNTIVVDGEEGVLLVDPGITEDEMACLANDLAQSGRSVVAGFATHPDWDHALWHAAFGDVPRYGTDRCAAYLRDLLEEVADDVEVVVPGHGAVGGPGQTRARIDLDRAYVHAVRDGRTPDDPRIGSSAEPGWEWVSDLHAGQVQRLTQSFSMRQSSRDCPEVKS
ncbi:MBL fold metallo-hydrolase [Amycolatopsis japonica]